MFVYVQYFKMSRLIVLTLTVTMLQPALANSVFETPWRYECLQGYCQKRENTEATQGSALSLAACRLFCAESGGIWPKPKGEVTIGNFLATINANSIDILGAKSETPAFELVMGAGRIFRQQVAQLLPKNSFPKGGKSLVINLVIQDHSIDQLTLTLDESYILKTNQSADGRLQAFIQAANFFGARHGLETLSQLIIFDDVREELQIARDVSISDQPAYPYRGILLDTSRNYITVAAIKNTLTGMAAAKLNSFHWHITDSHSFPYVSKSQPDLSRYGAYSRDKVYSPQDVKELIQFAKERGIRVVPEFDAPAHVGEGWQKTGLVTCFNWQPWQQYCVEPPCGQFDVTKPQLYEVIADIYGDMLEQFQPDIFHMGGDEVNFNCWNKTESMVNWMAAKGWGRTEKDFVRLWDHFQSQAVQKVYEKAGRHIPVVMWTSHLTHKEYLSDFLPKDQYIIQIWTTGEDEQVHELLTKGYKVILSNYDALYLDCGFAGWVADGNNWCSPYIGWQKVYQNTPKKLRGISTSKCWALKQRSGPNKPIRPP
uniref:Beta-hexosaminidase n=1 Tax=Dendroctonus ponderosae TaxID=77166 RepID=A0AAR5P4B0_DENPD